MLVNICQYLFIFTILLLNIEPNYSTQFTHDRKRVGPLDYVMAEHGCLKKFTVSENTIIRTQDSRFLGAKFLNESDIGNREDCLTFCCDTRYCDVAVFQEKYPFSCYLFDCGPPEDFICKFTSHTYYTSAVLAVNRHQLDLGVWSSQYQHEAELTDLRYTSENGNSESNPKDEQSPSLQTNPVPSASLTTLPAVVATTTTTTTTTSSPTTTTKSSSQSATSHTRKCSNFQFECHSGECIAIYNACDGIPQCKDGSDEGKELGCPQGPDRGIFNHRTNLLEYNHYPNEISPDYPREESLGYGGHGRGPAYYDYNQRQSQVSKYNLAREDSRKAEPSPIYHQDYPDYSLINRQREVQAVPKQQISNQQHIRQQIFSMPPKQQMQKNPLRNAAPQVYQQQNINNGPNWQGTNQQYTPYQGVPQKLHNHQHFEESLQDNTQRRFDPGREIPQQLVSDEREGTMQIESPKYNPLNHNIKENLPNDASTDPIKSSQRTQSIQSTEENKTKDIAAAAVTETNSKGTKASNIVDTKDATKISSDKLSTNNSQNIQSTPKEADKLKVQQSTAVSAQNETKTLVSKEDPSEHLVAHASLSHLTVNVEELEREEENQKSQTSGAILALSLGMTITVLLIVLVGCRIRRVKRRVRRRRGLRSPLEHDVDYLVNGMYL